MGQSICEGGAGGSVVAGGVGAVWLVPFGLDESGRMVIEGLAFVWAGTVVSGESGGVGDPRY